LRMFLSASPWSNRLIRTKLVLSLARLDTSMPNVRSRVRIARLKENQDNGRVERVNRETDFKNYFGFVKRMPSRPNSLFSLRKLPCDCEVRGHLLHVQGDAGHPGPGNRVVDKKRII
jgi:hypothetical protein